MPEFKRETLPFHVANLVTDRAVDFLIEQGGAYSPSQIGHLQAEVLEAITLDQYVLKVDDDGEIRFFAIWWWLTPNDIDGVFDSYARPYDVSNGTCFYVAEAAVRKGESMFRMVSAIRRKATRQYPKWQGCGWHNFASDKRPAFFRQQTGE